MKRFLNRISAKKFWILILKTYAIFFVLFSFGDKEVFNPFVFAAVSTFLFALVILMGAYEHFIKDPYIGIKNKRRFLKHISK